MVISDNREKLLNQDMFDYLRENEFIGLRLRLLLFWGKHPQAKFNFDGIAHFIATTRCHLKEMLKEFIDKGIVNEEYCESGVAHYCLNQDHQLSQHIQELAELDWGKINYLEEVLGQKTLTTLISAG
jgi:hypothetical protein